MAIIALRGMRFFAHHGFYPEEQEIGQEYTVDVEIDATVEQAGMTDDLSDTINYETVYHICQAIMREPSELLETVVQRMLSRIDDQFDAVRGVRVTLRKLHPPLAGPVEEASVQMSSGMFAMGDLGGISGGLPML